jgi:hypothetical protein
MAAAGVCRRSGCPNAADVAIELEGTNIDSGLPQHDVLPLCHGCAEVLAHSPTVTINGVKMTRDAAGVLRAVA